MANKEPKVVRAIDTGDIWECPICHRKYHLIHRAYIKNGKETKVLKHDLEEVIE